MLDIILTIWAWKRGWKGQALLPMVIAVFSVILFAAIGLVEMCFVVVIAEIGTLIFMVAKGKKETTTETYMNLEVPQNKTPINNQHLPYGF